MWSDAERVEAIDQFLERDTLIKAEQATPGIFIHINICTRNDGGFTDFGKGRGLAHLRCLGDGNREVALRDGDLAHADFLAHDDDARLFVNHNTGRLIGFDSELFHFRQEIDYVAVIAWWQGEANRGGVDRIRGRGAEIAIDCFRHPPGRREVRISK